MSELGFTKVYNMRGGIAKWKDAGYPVVRGSDPPFLASAANGERIYRHVPISTTVTLWWT